MGLFGRWARKSAEAIVTGATIGSLGMSQVQRPNLPEMLAESHQRFLTRMMQQAGRDVRQGVVATDFDNESYYYCGYCVGWVRLDSVIESWCPRCKGNEWARGRV